MRKTAGFLIVLLLTTLASITTSSGDETDTSHLAHLTAAFGPLITSCDVCHFVSYSDMYVDGQDFANTTVCDPCHSPGGAYDGVNDPNIGAKGNWVSGVYDGSALLQGKEKWCVGCHDDDPSMVNGVSAPNIAGNDIDYGYYKTGHGKHGYEQAITCLACHDQAFMHVDGEIRTYTADADNYQAGYRLKSVDGYEPIDVPRPKNVFTVEQFRLCFTCHDSAPFMNWDNTNTNFRRDVNYKDSCVALDPLRKNDHVNQHNFHLGGRGGAPSDSDFNGVGESSISCPACHNVHGPRLSDGLDVTNAPAMIRTGELIGRSSSLNLEYFVNSCPDRTLSATNETLDSTGGVMKFYGPGPGTVEKNGVCAMCHNEYQRYWREAKDILNCANCHGDLQAKHTTTPGSGAVIFFPDRSHDDAAWAYGQPSPHFAVEVWCATCHTNDLREIHGNDCAACHAGSTSPYESVGGNWAGGCQQGACHAVYHVDSSTAHLPWESALNGSQDCNVCHESSTWDVPSSSCLNCHATYEGNDNSPPVTSTDALAEYIGPARIKFSITDNGKVGVGRTYYKLNDGPKTGAMELYISDNETRTHTIEYWSVDQSGNEEEDHKIDTFIVNKDTEAPTTTSNAQATYYPTAVILLDATDNSTLGVQATYYRLDGGPIESGTRVVVSASGPHTLEFWSVDHSGNQDANEVEFTIPAAGTLKLVWYNSDTTGSPCLYDNDAAVSWQIDKVNQDTGAATTVHPMNGTWNNPHSTCYWSGVNEVSLLPLPSPYKYRVRVQLWWYNDDIEGTDQWDSGNTLPLFSVSPGGTTIVRY